MNFRLLLIQLFSLLFMSQMAIGQVQAPDFTIEDQYGTEHSLYADYLDLGKTVMISFGAAWAGPDQMWIEQGVLEEFHNSYAGASAAIMWMETDTTTIWDDLYGNTANFTYDFVSNKSYPIFNAEPEDEINDRFNVYYYPSIALICPDGSMYYDGDTSGVYGDIFYAQLGHADSIANRMFDYCSTVINRNLVTGTVFHDEDGNCELDSNEKVMPNVKVEIHENGNYLKGTYSQADGSYKATLIEGTFDVSVVPPNHLWAACNSPQTIKFDDLGGEAKIDLGLMVEEYCPYPEVSLSSPFIRRCFPSFIDVHYCNNGTEVLEEAYIEVELDTNFLNPTADAVFNQVGNILIFELGDIEVYECGRIRITFEVNCDAELGTEVCYKAEIFPDPCQNLENPTFDKECQEIIGAYDPNDKRAFPLGEDENYNYTVKPNELLEYQIRFQNTGTDTAFTVVVDDIISEELDLKTLKGGLSSHDYVLEIEEGRLLKFTFNNIMLPDSNVNLLGSNGYVNYTIEQNPDLSNGTLIKNNADIFFDFNEAVRTNETVHTVDDGISSIKEISLNNLFDINPNPASDVITISLKDLSISDDYTCEILNLQGQKLLTQTVSTKNKDIDVSQFESGVYLIQLSNGEGLFDKELLVITK